MDADGAAIGDAVDRILVSDDFARATRLRELLRFVVDEERAGRGDRLKAFVIAQEVFGRDETFDAQNDTIVRVEMGRLRRRLEHYYVTAGANDPLHVEIPRGSYVPVFTAPASSPAAESKPTITPAPAAHEHIAQHAGPRFASTTHMFWLGLGLVAVLLAGWLATRPAQPVHGRAIDTKPYVAVLPLVTLTASGLELRLATGLIEALITDLARLRNLSVMAHSSVLGLDSENPSVVALRDDYGATHILRGSLEHEASTVRTNLHLIDTSTGRIVWAYRNDQILDESILQLESKIAFQIATSMSALVDSAEALPISGRPSTDLVTLELYRQAMIAMTPPSDPSRVKSARLIFAQILESDPEFAGGPAGIGFTHALAVMSRWSTDPVEDLARGKALARDAIALEDAFALGHATLAFIHALEGLAEPALAAADAALARQPGDAMIQFIAGLTRSTLKQPDQAIPYYQEALRLDPIDRRAPYLNLLAISYLATGNPERCVLLLERNIARGGPWGAHMELYRAVAYAELGRDADARHAIEVLRRGPLVVNAAGILRGAMPSQRASRALAHLARLGYLPGEGPSQDS